MSDRPILFSAPMVRALLAGRKTQTRRILKPDLQKQFDKVGESIVRLFPNQQHIGWDAVTHLWVRETWQTHCDLDCITPRDLPTDTAVQYPATYDGWVSKRRPGIHMPRWASRLTLRVTEVRAQKLQEISEADAAAEGIESIDCYRDEHPLSICYAVLWDRINGPDAWQANPWVAAISFTVHRCNIDAMEKIEAAA